MTYIVADTKGNIIRMTTAISAYKKPATNVHCKLIVKTYTKNMKHE